ncbi:hypothetical protein TrRE_jg13266 [Triparma retinervis]|uniref:Amino acid transporter transmembrane domain-containing protein n=1 Tax=Triparma retinervis TaxID=2557542 RepID=A0A9W7CGY5_9STRA|nr:hypothetical protein TrRE_jg13266 [Triparma retinervis]
MSYFSSILGGPLPTLCILGVTQAVNVYAGEQLLGAVEKVEDEKVRVVRVTDLPTLAGEIPSHKWATALSFDANLFLVLGAYLLTMENCLIQLLYPLQPPRLLLGALNVAILVSLNSTVGRTMGKLGRAPAVISVTTILASMGICLVSAYMTTDPNPDSPAKTYGYSVPAAVSGIAFAVGSQKLLLNVRAELEDVSSSSKVLRYGLAIMSLLYGTIICLTPSSNPPSFLLDILDAGSLSSRLASFSLFIHVAISFSINSQALVRRLVENCNISWLQCTTIISVSTLITTLLVPSFASLTSLIGALTSIPLTLTLPMIFGVASTARVGWRLR